MLDQFVFVYLGDILRARPLSSLALFQEYFCVIFSSDEQMHIQLVRQVLQRLLNHPLFVSCFTVIFGFCGFGQHHPGGPCFSQRKTSALCLPVQDLSPA